MQNCVPTRVTRLKNCVYIVVPTHIEKPYIILTGQDVFLSKIQCGMFKGTTRAVFVDKRDYEGHLWQQVEEAFKFVLKNIRLGARIEGPYRKDIYELAPDNICEIIIYESDRRLGYRYSETVQFKSFYYSDKTRGENRDVEGRSKVYFETTTK